ncbi:hypothetical protein [Sphingobium sp. DEHP117]|uniref:hypothetical protein n=1 Tax=Sphingobium sp. DEHP117 TaxID=2993436 RepID=UPI0035A01E7C
MMKKSLHIATLSALFALAACNNDQPEVIDRSPQDPLADQLNNAAPVELPPSVKVSKSYRCGDGSLLFVDFMSDDKTAMVKTEKEGTATKLQMAEPGKPYTAPGYSLTGNGDAVTAELPGKGSQSCKA